MSLRESDPDAAREWRFVMRENLLREFAAGREIIGVTPHGDYVLDITENESLVRGS